jgi:HK97 family phage major capsid protein
MTSKELREQRAKLVADAQALVPADVKNLTSELRTKIETMLADAQGMATLIAALEREENTADEQRAKNLNLANTDSVEHADNEAVRTAFRSYLRTGKIEQRDLTVGSDGVFIPTFVSAPVVAKKSAGFIYNLVGKIKSDTGAPIKVPTWNDTSNSFVLNSTAISTTDPSVGDVPISIDDYRFNPLLLDNSLIQDSSFNIEDEVVQSIYLRYQRDMSKNITLGNGSNIAGLTSITAGITSATTNTLGFADFVSMLANLDPAYMPNAVWTLSQATLGVVLNMVDSNKRPLFLNWDEGASAGFSGKILGLPVALNVNLPSVATGNVAVQLGDYSEGYKFRELASGIMVKRLSERWAELNRTGFVAFTRVGGAPVDAGTHPIISCTIK